MKTPIIPRLLLGLLATACSVVLLTRAQAANYSLSGDFSYAANPSGAWSYHIDDWANATPTFPLMTSTDLDANALWGTDFSPAPMMWSEGSGYWGIGKNTTGGELVASGGVTWGVDEILFHPKGGDSPSRFVIGWTSPADLVIDVTYVFSRGMSCGGGVGYQLIKRSGGTDTVIEDFGVGGTTASAPIDRSQIGMGVAAGDQLFWRIDTWGDAGCDITKAAIEISGTTLGDPPVIVSQPVGGTVAEGDDFRLSVAATGAQTYEWQKDGVPIAGANQSSYVISDVSVADAGSYTVTVSNSAGAETSDAAVLNVTAAPVFGSYAEAVLSANAIHYYPLDETSGPTAMDIGSLATTGGSFSNGVTLGVASASPAMGTAIQMDGAAGTLVDLGLFHPGDAVSVEAWFLMPTDARAGWSAMVSRIDGSYELAINSDLGVSFAVFNDSGAVGQAWSPSVPTRGQWHHVVGVFGGGKLVVYLDGVKGPEQSHSGVLQDAGPTPDRVMIGATRDGVGGNSFNWKGLIDEVAIYDYALGAAQIRGHYRHVTSVEPGMQIQSAVLISWPNFPPGYVLQWANDVAGPYENYPGSVFLDGGSFVAPVPTTNTQQYFQLLKP